MVGAIEVFLDFVDSGMYRLKPWNNPGEWLLLERFPDRIPWCYVFCCEEGLWKLYSINGAEPVGALPEYANLLIETADYELCARLMIVTLGEETRSRLGWDEVLPSREIPLAQGYSVSMRDEFYGALVDPDGNELDMRCGRRDLNKLSLTFEYPLWGLVSSYADMWGRPYFVDMIGKYYLNREGRLLDLTTPRIVLPETFSNLEAEVFFPPLNASLASVGSVSKKMRTRDAGVSIARKVTVAFSSVSCVGCTRLESMSLRLRLLLCPIVLW